MEFDWNPQKAESNLAKHGVSFHEAGTIFGDPLAITFDDPDHSVGEFRYLTFGLSRLENLLIVSYTERDGKIRIISARRMIKKERQIYEKG